MDAPKVPPPSAVDQLSAVLDSPEIAALVSDLEATRWTGRPGYPIRSMVGMALAKSVYAMTTLDPHGRAGERTFSFAGVRRRHGRPG